MPVPVSLSAALRDRRNRRWVLLCGVLLVAFGYLILFASLRGMPDFRDFEAGPERKSRFLEFVVPLVREENGRILERRERLVAIAAKERPGWFDRRWLRRLAEDYADDGQGMEIDQLIELLLRRVDAVPLALALAQAAKESGWGTSRFAREGNNLFGEWCYRPGCGIVPGARRADRRHEVRAFDSPRESVRSYLHNINTHRGYRDLRLARAQLRARDRPVTALALVPYLGAYSERGEAYVSDIRSIVLSNDLESFSGTTDD